MSLLPIAVFTPHAGEANALEEECGNSADEVGAASQERLEASACADKDADGNLPANPAGAGGILKFVPPQTIPGMLYYGSANSYNMGYTIVFA